MGRSRPRAGRVHTIAPTTPAALLGAAGPVAAEASGVAAPPPPSRRALEQYEPPPLAAGFAGGVTTEAAAAQEAAAPVPLDYNPELQRWILLADYSYDYGGHTLTAKKGFAYDLASVPRPLWWLIAPNELSLVAPLFHDLLYQFGGRLPVNQVREYRTYTRREADDFFYHLMEVEGIEWWRRNAAYSAVRAAGGSSWQG